MTKLDIMTLTCKIVAFVIFVDALANFFSSVIMILASFGDAGPSSMRVSSILVSSGQVLVITACVLLWLKAERIAGRFNPKSTSESALLIDGTLVPSIIALAGIVLFILAISIVFNSSSRIYALSQLTNHVVDMRTNSRLIAAVFQMAIGIGLFFGANGISQKLRNRIYGEAQA